MGAKFENKLFFTTLDGVIVVGGSVGPFGIGKQLFN
jgi:hypothetical protein